MVDTSGEYKGNTRGKEDTSIGTDQVGTESKVDASVCQSGRKSCYQARDEYYQCIDNNSDPKEAGKLCRRLRERFEKSCKRSWVKHFDATRDKELEVLRTLKKNINQSARNGAVGGLAGRDQRSS